MRNPIFFKTGLRSSNFSFVLQFSEITKSYSIPLTLPPSHDSHSVVESIIFKRPARTMESRPLQELSPLESKLSSLSCTACIQCTLCFLQFFLVGSAHSIGVFTVPVERYASPAHSLDGVWVASIGSISFMSALISLFVHYLLDALPVPSETYRVRALSAVSTLALLLFSVSAYGVYLQSIPIIAIFVGMYSVPLTIRKSFHICLCHL